MKGEVTNIIEFPRSKQICPSCEATSITRELRPQSFQYGKGDDALVIEAEIPIYICQECTLEYCDEEAERIRHDAICDRLNVLKPKQIRAIRDRFQMNRTEFAILTGIGEASLARWESSAQIQTPAMDLLLRLVARSSPAEVASMRVVRPRPSADLVQLRKQFQVLDLTPEMQERSIKFALRK